jgi:uncharacterized membrane protein YqjE
MDYYHLCNGPEPMDVPGIYILVLGLLVLVIWRLYNGSEPMVAPGINILVIGLLVMVIWRFYNGLEPTVVPNKNRLKTDLKKKNFDSNKFGIIPIA